MLIAFHLENLLIELGYEVVGPAMRLQPALMIAQEEPLDLALLDVNLAGEQSFPVARALRQRAIPFVFATGYGSGGVEAEFKGVVILQKPFEERALAEALARTCRPGADD